MWAGFDRNAYPREQFAAQVAATQWSSWKPNRTQEKQPGATATGLAQRVIDLLAKKT